MQHHMLITRRGPTARAHCRLGSTGSLSLRTMSTSGRGCGSDWADARGNPHQPQWWGGRVRAREIGSVKLLFGTTQNEMTSRNYTQSDNHPRLRILQTTPACTHIKSLVIVWVTRRLAFLNSTGCTKYPAALEADLYPITSLSGCCCFFLGLLCCLCARIDARLQIERQTTLCRPRARKLL